MSKIRNFINEKVDFNFYFTSSASDTLLVIKYFLGQIYFNTVKFKYLTGQKFILKAPYELNIDFALDSLLLYF